jgi:hypothetical protein
MESQMLREIHDKLWKACTALDFGLMSWLGISHLRPKKIPIDR